MEALLYLVLAALTILASVTPAVLYSLVVWWLDRYEKEPWGLLAATFFWGAVPAIVLSLVAEFVLGMPFSGLLGEATAQLLQGGLLAPIVEESVKGVAILLIFLVFRAEFDGLLDGIVYGALVGFGFGMTENALYFLGALLEGGAGTWLLVVFMRTLVFGLNHGLFSAIVGLGFGYASIAGSAWQRWLIPPLGLGGAIAVHAVHNLSTSAASELCWPVLISLANDWGGVLVLILMVFLSWDRERAWIVEELRDEMAAGTLSAGEYETAASYHGRLARQWRALVRDGVGQARLVRRFFQLATELAFAKRRLRGSLDLGAEDPVISAIRGELTALRASIAEQ
jgi:RsiW-degrading membrane proteinase PrsW (M82 family)